jgi:hypothetical protein
VPIWRFEGVGELKPEGRRAEYRATSVGSAVIVASDPDNSDVYATCDVTVTGEPQLHTRIRGHWFKYSFNPLGNSRPVRMIRGDVNLLIVNTQSLGLKLAQEKGDQRAFILQAIATEFARFEVFQLGQLNPTEMSPHDFERTTEDILDASDQLFVEMNKTKKEKK